jgi:hypothetical protein
MTFINFESILLRRNGASIAALFGLLVAAGHHHWPTRTAELLVFGVAAAAVLSLVAALSKAADMRWI